jgi:hypothetical protein
MQNTEHRPHTIILHISPWCCIGKQVADLVGLGLELDLVVTRLVSSHIRNDPLKACA